MALSEDQIVERNLEFQLQNNAEEYQLYRLEENMAVYVNQGTAVIWQLCDGVRNVKQIKKLLMDAYPESKQEINDDVDQTLEMLISHTAITLK